MPLCGFGWITQEFTPHRGGETEALKRLEDSLADTVKSYTSPLAYVVKLYK
jgi:hypothetical protein